MAAATALQTLTQTNKSLEQTQNRISTGMRVASAADNAAYWSIATTMRSDNAALSTVEDALGLGSATIDVAYTAVDQAINVVGEIKKKLTAAREPGVDRDKIQSEVTELQAQLRGIGSAAVFSGENWLKVDSDPASGYNSTKSIVSSFSRSGSTVTIDTVEIDTSDMVLFDDYIATDPTHFGLLDGARFLADGALDPAGAGDSFSIAGETDGIDVSALTDSSADLTTLEQYIQAVDVAMGELTEAATSLGSVKSRVDLQKNFVSVLRDAIDRGIGQLVDADMNEESTRLQALQVQAQLGIQALSIANSSSQNILALFR
jgi:flagellin